MQSLSRGHRVKLNELVDVQAPFHVSVHIKAGFSTDIACFGLNAAGVLFADPYMVFFNQLHTPCGAVRLELGPQVANFVMDLSRLPAEVQRLVITATVDGDAVMGKMQEAVVQVLQNQQLCSQFSLLGQELSDEKALLITEIYRKDGVWRQAALGDGFRGGLPALLAHFGGQEADAQPQTPAPPVSVADAPKVSLNKAVRLEKELQHKAPQLVSLVKSAYVSLEKRGLQGHVAKVCLVLDISASMVELYRRGVVQRICERLLALACLFDDDQSIDVFLFDSRAIDAGEMSVDNINGAVDRLIANHRLGGGTDYAPAMNMVRSHYKASSLPVYALFVTDGAPGDKLASQKALREASHEPIFWQYVGVGGGRFDFLEKLDELRNRLIDNASFFAVKDPSSISDDEIYRLLLEEYPDWLLLARQNQLLPSQ